MKSSSLLISLFLLAGAVACGGDTSGPPVEYYRPAYRQTPPAPVYSRMTWSQLPNPIQPKGTASAPLILPVVSFELPNSNLQESVEALAQAMGYRWDYPKSVARRPVSIKMEASVEDILKEIGRQANVQAMFDHEQRVVRVVEKGMLPRLPGS